MLTVGNIKVSWHYSTDEVPFFSVRKPASNKLSAPEPVKTTTRRRDITTCAISIDDNVMAIASVVRGWNDKQCYETARKISLKRATECVILGNDDPIPAFTKAQRKAIWEAYRTSTKVPRWNVTKK